MEQNLLELKNVNKSFGSNKVLKDINLSIKKGEVVCIIGPVDLVKVRFYDALILFPS